MGERTVLVLFGPKGVGKSTIADLLSRRLGLHHVDADPLVLALVERGVQPDPLYGWLEPVKAAVDEALQHHELVAVEATGAWPTDWEIADRLRHDGHVVRCVRLIGAKETTMARAKARMDRRVPTSDADLEWIYEQSAMNCEEHVFDAQIDTDEPLNEDAVVRAIERVLAA
ncbi:MAG: AAA family ATPase [Actinomycetota bacterium]